MPAAELSVRTGGTLRNSRRHTTGAAASAGGQKGRSMRVSCSADIDPEASMEAPRSWESKGGGAGRSGRSLMQLQLDPTFFVFFLEFC